MIEYWADNEDDPERRGDYCWLLGAADALDVTISQLVEEAREKCPARCDCKTCRPELYVGGVK